MPSAFAASFGRRDSGAPPGVLGELFTLDPRFALRTLGEFGRDRGNVNQNTPTRDQCGDTSGFDFIPQPPRRNAKASGRQVQR
jgi:hypothetical protein